MDWRILLGFGGFLIVWSGFVMGIVKYLIDKNQDHFDKEFQSLRSEIFTRDNKYVRMDQRFSGGIERVKAHSEAVEKKLLKHQIEVGRDFMRKTDCIRNTNMMDEKLDRMYEVMTGISDRIINHETKKNEKSAN